MNATQNRATVHIRQWSADMATTVGTSSDFTKLIENFILLEHDAIAAYDETAKRLEEVARRAKVKDFRQDHLRHLQDLKELARRHGATVPGEGDMKEILTTGKVKLADMVGGDGAILKAMATNESDTISAYQNAVDNAAVPETEKELFRRGLSDEQRHKSWMDSEAAAA